jgi:hypothetical protein
MHGIEGCYLYQVAMIDVMSLRSLNVEAGWEVYDIIMTPRFAATSLALSLTPRSLQTPYASTIPATHTARK